MTAIVLAHPNAEFAREIAEGLAQMFARPGWTVTVVDDPDLERVARGFTYSEYQDDPEREVERLAAIVARATLQPVSA